MNLILTIEVFKAENGYIVEVDNDDGDERTLITSEGVTVGALIDSVIVGNRLTKPEPKKR